MTYIPGYVATLTINGSDLEVFSSDAALNLTTEVLNKTTLGVVDAVFIPGLQGGTIDITMHTDTVGMVDIQAAYASTTEVAFVFRPGSLGALDAGSWAGVGILNDLTVGAAVDDNWATTISVQCSGPINYTPPV